MSGDMKIRQFYFVDEEPQGKSLDEYLLMFGPKVDGDGLQLYQCTSQGYFDEEAALLVLERGDAVSVSDGNLHQAIRCQLVSESWLEGADDDLLEEYDVLNVPPEFTGAHLPEVEGLDDNQLAPLNLSINMARFAEQDENSETKTKRESIWRRLGRKTKSLF